MPKRTLIAAVRKADILFCLLHDAIDRDVIAANPNLRLIAAQSITPVQHRRRGGDGAAHPRDRDARRSPPRRPPTSISG